MLRESDAIIYPSRAQTADILAGLRRVLGFVPDGVPEFLGELEASCFEASLDFPILASHAANECNIWRDDNWADKWNAFGIGITGPGVVGVIFPSPAACARFAVAEYLLKLRRPLGAFADARQYAPAKFDRVKALVNGGDWPNVERISDLNTPFGDGDFVWMEDSSGPAAIVAKGNALLPSLKDQTTGGPTDVVLTFSKDMTSRTNGRLTNTTAFITIHNNGNPSSDRFDEAQFVKSGGGAGVMYHGAIDSGGVVQIMPLDQQGVHAGNAEGNRTSIAFEMCEGSEPWADVKEHTSQMLAEIVTNRLGLFDYGTFGPGNFSLDRVREHRDWPGANPNCPRRLIQTDGGVEKVVARARQIVAAGTVVSPPTHPGPTYAIPAKPSWWAAQKASGYPENHDLNGVRFFGLRTEMAVNKATVQRATASAKGKASGPDLAKGTRVLVEGVFRNGSGKWVLAAEDKTMKVADAARIALKDLSENINVTERSS